MSENTAEIETFQFEGDTLVTPVETAEEVLKFTETDRLEENGLLDFGVIEDLYYKKLLALKVGFDDFLKSPLIAEKKIEKIFEGLPSKGANEDIQMSLFSHAWALNRVSECMRAEGNTSSVVDCAAKNFNPINLGMNVRELFFNHPTKTPEEVYVQLVKDIVKSPLIKERIHGKLDDISASAYLSFLPILAYRGLLQGNLNKSYMQMLTEFDKNHPRHPFQYFEYLKNKDMHAFERLEASIK